MCQTATVLLLPHLPAIMDCFSLDLQARISPVFSSCSLPGYCIPILKQEMNTGILAALWEKHRAQKFLLWPQQKLVPQDYHTALPYHCVYWENWWKFGVRKGKADKDYLLIRSSKTDKEEMKAMLRRWWGQCIKLVRRGKVRGIRYPVDIHVVRMCRQPAERECSKVKITNLYIISPQVVLTVGKHHLINYLLTPLPPTMFFFPPVFKGACSKRS